MRLKEQNEKTKEWLWRYREAKRECRRLEGEYQELVESQKSAKAIEYSGMPKAHSTERDLSDLMLMRDDYLEKYREVLNMAEKFLVEISDAISSLPDQLSREVMSLRYLQLDGCRPRGWEEIGNLTGYTEQYVCQKHGESLEKIHMIIKEHSLS